MYLYSLFSYSIHQLLFAIDSSIDLLILPESRLIFYATRRFGFVCPGVGVGGGGAVTVVSGKILFS